MYVQPVHHWVQLSHFCWGCRVLFIMLVGLFINLSEKRTYCSRQMTLNLFWVVMLIFCIVLNMLIIWWLNICHFSGFHTLVYRWIQGPSEQWSWGTVYRNFHQKAWKCLTAHVVSRRELQHFLFFSVDTAFFKCS